MPYHNENAGDMLTMDSQKNGFAKGCGKNYQEKHSQLVGCYEYYISKDWGLLLRRKRFFRIERRDSL